MFMRKLLANHLRAATGRAKRRENFNLAAPAMGIGRIEHGQKNFPSGIAPPYGKAQAKDQG
jgi:hypothetical protein